MATAETVIFQGNKENVYISALETVNEVGYPIAETDDMAKKFVYYAKRSRSRYYQSCEITVTVSGNRSGDTFLSIKAVTDSFVKSSQYSQVPYPDVFEVELIGYIIFRLKKRFRITDPPRNSSLQAPGINDIKKDGCMAVLAFLTLMAGSGLSGLLLLLSSFFIQ